MSPEEYERIKAQEKAHLREIKRLQDLARDAGRQGRLASALEGITGALGAGDATRQEMVDRLNRGSAHAEARMELALDGQAEAERQAALAAEGERLEREGTEARAKETLAAMKAALGMGDAAERAPAVSADPATAKTLGRATGADEAPPPAPPGKTFGRAE